MHTIRVSVRIFGHFHDDLVHSISQVVTTTFTTARMTKHCFRIFTLLLLLLVVHV